VAKKSSIEKNNKRKRMVKSQSASRAALKAIIMNRELPVEERIAAQFKMNEMPRDGSKSRIRNRCELTGRSRGYYRKFQMSRIALRELGNFGQIPGLVKSSW
jgi:small subunit ribosomal protein S14